MQKKGFTLIELLVVIAIIGILSGVVLASLNVARLKARNAQRISDVRQVQLALTAYFDDQVMGSYPVEAAPGATLSTTHLSATYLPQLPFEQTVGRSPYIYMSRGTGDTDYCFGVSLEGLAPRIPDNNRADCLGVAAIVDPGINYTVGP